MSLPMPTTGRQGPTAAALDPRQLEAMDAPFIALTQQCGGDLRQLMYAFFSFLSRRTDFFLVPHPDDVGESKSGRRQHKMGFPEGDAEKLLIAAFRQFPLRRIPKGGIPRSSSSPQKKPAEKKAKAKKPVPSSSTTKSDSKKKDVESSSSSSDSSETKTDPKNVTEKHDNDDKQNVPSNMKGVRYNEEGLQIPEGNGGSTPRYKWTQTIDETTVLIGVPKDFRGKDYNVSITATRLSVKAKRCLPGEDIPRTFLEGKLVDAIRADESTWSLEGGVLTVTLEKARKKFWTAVCEDDVEKYKIDTELVDSRRRIDEYDDATQAQFRKCIFDQNQYHLGGPTSDEILGKTKNIPGLPPYVQYKDGGDTANTKPQLPPGVDFIDKKTLDDAEKGSQ